MSPEYKDRLNIHGCSSAIKVIENLEKQTEKQKETILSLRQEIERLEKELSLAIEIIEDSGIDYDEVVEAKEQNNE